MNKKLILSNVFSVFYQQLFIKVKRKDTNVYYNRRTNQYDT